MEQMKVGSALTKRVFILLRIDGPDAAGPDGELSISKCTVASNLVYF